jgi:hypothetical protein
MWCIKIMTIWKDKSLWIYEIGLAVMFMIMAALVLMRTHDLQNALVFFAKMVIFMQPIILGAHFVDRKYRRRK